MDFWLQRQGQGWQAVGHGETIPAGVYTLIVQSPQPHFTLPVHCRHYPPHPSPGQQQPLHSWDSTARTNEEGIAVLAHELYLEPGWWEWCCRDGDLIAELFGDPQNDRLIVQVVGEPEPAAAPAVIVPAPVAEPAVDFTLMRQELAGSPGSKVIVAGRTSCAGDIVMELASPEGVLISQGRQSVKMWGEGKSVAFSVSLLLPDHPWTQPLQGQAELYQGSQLLARQSFRVACQAEPPSPLMTNRPKLWQEDELVPGSPPEPTPPLSWPSSWVDEQCERSVQKLLRLAQLAPEPPGAVPGSEPELVGDLTITLPDSLVSQQTIEIKVTVAATVPPCSYVELSVLHGQTQECLDGPRYLLHWQQEEQGYRSSSTRMTIPSLKTELVWVARWIDPDNQQQGEPVRVSRLIRR
ncbi:MAG: hypothetical protein Q6J68_01280 [Thermostichales cyanobacterium SZTDM-1c_bins_54]